MSSCFILFCFLNFPPPSSAFSDFSFVERKERGKKRSEKKLGGMKKNLKPIGWEGWRRRRSEHTRAIRNK